MPIDVLCVTNAEVGLGVVCELDMVLVEEERVLVLLFTEVVVERVVDVLVTVVSRVVVVAVVEPVDVFCVEIGIGVLIVVCVVEIRELVVVTFVLDTVGVVVSVKRDVEVVVVKGVDFCVGEMELEVDVICVVDPPDVLITDVEDVLSVVAVLGVDVFVASDVWKVEGVDLVSEVCVVGIVVWVFWVLVGFVMEVVLLVEIAVDVLRKEVVDNELVVLVVVELTLEVMIGVIVEVLLVIDVVDTVEVRGIEAVVVGLTLVVVGVV